MRTAPTSLSQHTAGGDSGGKRGTTAPASRAPRPPAPWLSLYELLCEVLHGRPVTASSHPPCAMGTAAVAVSQRRKLRF